MGAMSIAAGEKSNRGTDRSVGRFTTDGRSISALLRRARLLWASKVALELAARTGMSVRAAERWLAGDRAMSGEAVVALLQSDKGVAFLDALIEDMPDGAQRRWREEFERAARRADLRARREALEREIEEQEAGTAEGRTGSQRNQAGTAEGRTGSQRDRAKIAEAAAAPPTALRAVPPPRFAERDQEKNSAADPSGSHSPHRQKPMAADALAGGTPSRR